MNQETYNIVITQDTEVTPLNQFLKKDNLVLFLATSSTLPTYEEKKAYVLRTEETCVNEPEVFCSKEEASEVLNDLKNNKAIIFSVDYVPSSSIKDNMKEIFKSLKIVPAETKKFAQSL